MTAQRILVPIDFSEVSKNALALAISIALKSQSQVSLFNVENSSSTKNALEKMKHLVAELPAEASVEFDFEVSQGAVLKEISRIARPGDYKMIVIGSHGYKSIREVIFGVDILKLLKAVSIPALTIQHNYAMPKSGFERILLPLAPHKIFDKQIEAVIVFAEMYNSEVHIYASEKHGLELLDPTKANLKQAVATMQNRNIRHKVIMESPESFSIGFGKHILDYAERADIHLISIIADASKEHAYIADTDKTTLLTNALNIPVLSVSEKCEQ